MVFDRTLCVKAFSLFTVALDRLKQCAYAYDVCLTLDLAVCRPDGLLGMATHRILHKVEPGKLKMELTDKKGTNTGEISFILQASGGRFAQSSGTGTGSGMGTGTGTTSQHGTGHGTGSGMGAGAGAGAAALAAGSYSCPFFSLQSFSLSHQLGMVLIFPCLCRSWLWPWHSHWHRQ